MSNIIDDQLPGGPQWIENLDHQPVWVEDKSQLKRELDARNLQPMVKSERTPSAKSDDPRFYAKGIRALTQAPAQTFQTAAGLIGTRETKLVSRERMAILAQTWDVLCDPLNGLGYQVICPRCSRLFGEGQDGVRAENNPVAGFVKVECGCTVNIYQAR